MMEAKRRREQRSMLPVHPDAAAIDVGATVHVAAVGPARDAEPVRSFGTFTGDLYRLTDWFAQCGIKTVVMESTGAYAESTHSDESADPSCDLGYHRHNRHAHHPRHSSGRA